MKEFDYKLDYKKLNFRKPEIRKLYRIGRGEQGVLLVGHLYKILYVETGDLKTLKDSRRSAVTIYHMYYKDALKDFIGMDMCRKFLEMGFKNGQEDIRITKMVKNTKMVKYYRKKKDLTSEKAKSD